MALQATYVLVHGAFHGGWCWRPVAEGLRRLGHRVFTPTLTGLGERQHLLSPAVDLNLWVGDITTLVGFEDLSDIILVGHSFGGQVISGVADRCRQRIRHLVFLDGGPAEPGVPVASAMPRVIWDARMATIIERSLVPCFPTPPAAYFGVHDPALAAWVESRLTPMPVSVYTTPLSLARPVGVGLPVSFIHCTSPVLELAARAATQARALGWEIIEVPASHEAMLTAPAEIASILHEIGSRGLTA
jgi:pimeloyl-ACP methyl ester carboxylesterase